MAYKSASLNLGIPRMGAAEGAAADPAGLGSAMWVYRSADAVATVIAAGYINDGNDKGVQINDCVVVVDDNVPTIDVTLVTAVAANGDVTLLNGT